MKLGSISELSAEILDRFYGENGQTIEILRIGLNEVEKIDAVYSYGLPEYLESKVFEFACAEVMGIYIKMRVQKTLGIKMAYFQHDLFNGIDCWLSIDRRRVGADITAVDLLDKKIEAKKHIDATMKSKQRIDFPSKNRNPLHTDKTIGRIAVGIPESTRRFVNELLKKCGSLDQLTGRIHSEREIPGIREIRTVSLNPKGESWLKGFNLSQR